MNAIFLWPLINSLRSATAIYEFFSRKRANSFEFSSTISLTDGAESNCRRKKPHESANGGLTATIREPSIIVDTTAAFNLERT